ncbi:hypothetical protein BDY21DRAFT_384184 [Lineolata rhizophorae]|uniref:UspA domain-containing protein n=1 Tax=Lineolata rhizophorae TaxID=578093 RepID=A0A6A6P9L5_9PEZI|nr:hypothetical protein BDY21DRAFT_384184 [Lineolata rhizophorae]
MSLESAMDEERREVLRLLEGLPSRPRPNAPGDASATARAASPAGAKSPVRSMLDIAGAGPAPTPQGRHASIAGTGVGAGGPGSPNPEEAYQFEMLPSIESHALPKRVTQGGKKPKGGGAMAAVFGGGGGGGGDRGGGGVGVSRGGEDPNLRPRHNSTAGVLGITKSLSPQGRPGNRSASPGGRRLNNNSLNLMADPNKYVSESGKVVDMQSAYRRLSDAALLRSGGSLAKLPTRKGSDPAKGEVEAPGGGIRLQKDYDEEALESSDDSDDSSGGEENSRGRRRTRSKESGKSEGGKSTKSLLAAAEEERKSVASTYKVRSLLEPEVTITGPDGQKLSRGKTGVHPNTSFDQGGSGVSTPVDSDTEDQMSDIKRAQRMALNISPIHSTPEAYRCVRQIIRGEYEIFQREAEQGMRRQRVFLVATDLSDEAEYALEWTIGTVLRDGDTLLAVYAVDEEVGTGGETNTIGIGEGASAMKDTDTLMKTISREQGVGRDSSPSPGTLNPLSPTLQEGRRTPDFSAMGKAEKERYHATMEVSERCIKLLRKTKLQVRVVVEVFHCKSPKHMICEVIDFLEPTLVILGSRGRSALKGVLLGSFSNYLVTKSSVPVMVARKRLRKHSKYKRTNVRLSNNISGPSNKLAFAKID